VPLTQVPDLQTIPHAPQFCVSLLRSLQPPDEQQTSPALQAPEPWHEHLVTPPVFAQISPGKHCVPAQVQTPSVVTHALPAASVASHCTSVVHRHWPATQAKPLLPLPMTEQS